MRTGRELVHYSRSGLCTPNLCTWLRITALREDLGWGCTYNFQCSSLQHCLFRAASVFQRGCPRSCHKHLSLVSDCVGISVEGVILSAEDRKDSSSGFCPLITNWLDAGSLDLGSHWGKGGIFYNLLRVQNTVSEESRAGLGACDWLLNPQVFHCFGHHLTWEFDKREIKSPPRQLILSLFKWWVVSSLRRSLMQNLNLRNFRHCFIFC
jgi:hypothetical protein